ncbi:hypothetical protein RDI58_013409 [Solanum bulbocastanum]|uniref:Uncharacterized protein n=1 Tax=Solanum bulbocastanum TaxID=147425 RepID=A0AAN8YDZ2_SOLBU
MLIKNRHIMPTPSAVSTTPLHPDKLTHTSRIITMRLYRLLIKGRQYTKLVPTARFGPPSSNLAGIHPTEEIGLSGLPYCMGCYLKGLVKLFFLEYPRSEAKMNSLFSFGSA